MKIYLGSANQVKIETVREVLQLYPNLRTAQVQGLDISSGVSSQPKTLEETMKGARNRAKNAFAQDAYLSIGLESGFWRIPGARKSETYMEHTVCVIYDGNKEYIGFSPAFELPPKMVELVLKKHMDLEQATKELQLTTNERVGRAEGLIGILTTGIMDRKAYMKPAIIMALAAWHNKHLY